MGTSGSRSAQSAVAPRRVKKDERTQSMATGTAAIMPANRAAA